MNTMYHTALLVSILISNPPTAKARMSRADHLAEREARLVTQAVPQDGDVCFSPAEPCDAKLIKLVGAAQKSLEIAIYDLNLDQLVHQILVQSKKMPVRILVDKRQAQTPASLVPLLLKAGANVRFGRQRGIMHNKFVIVDGKMLETGSFNFTNHASESNNENQIYLTDVKIVKRYRDHFEDIWAKGKPAEISRAISSAVQ